VQQRKSIAIVCPLFGASRIYYTELLDAVINQASERGYEVLIVPITDTTFKRALSSHFPQISSIAGIILITCQVQNSTWLEECASKKLPVVLLHDNITQRNAQGYSVVSHIQPRLNALSEAIRHLVVKHSCRNISVVMVNPEKHRIREEKLFLIERAIREMELPFERERQLYYVKNYSHKQGLLVTNRIVENNPDTDAIICLADLAAIGVMHRLTELNLHKHIRVTGFDNVEFALQNDLTTIDQELKITGERALTDLHTAIQSGSISEFQTISEIPTTFVPRGSCCFL
jgi:DNA-binding LacI/PurR family transcriptional regulator